MRHVISALVQNEPGVLSQISGMFAARGYNIDSLVVGRTEDPGLSRITLVVLGDDRILEQAVKQLAKLVSVVDVADYKDVPCVERDMMMIRIGAPASKRTGVLDLVNLFRGKVVDISHESLVVELAGPEAKIEAFIELACPHGIIEVTRTGILAVPRGLHRPRTHSNSAAAKSPKAKKASKRSKNRTSKK